LTVLIRNAQLTDLDELVALEKSCFETDRLSRRSFKHWITTEHRALLVAEVAKALAGYILIIYHPGTRLARIYSIAVSHQQRGLGLAKLMMSRASKPLLIMAGYTCALK